MAKVLGIITARGGSKSVPRKNIKPFCGKPLIAWTIESARKSGALDRIIVSTDDAEISQISTDAGAEAPFMRPPELSLDTTPTLPVLQHAVEWLRTSENYIPDYVLLLQPTSPAREAFHITDAISIATQSNCDSVISLTEVPGHHNFHWQISLNQDKAGLANGTKWEDVIPRRQELPKTYIRDGIIYLFKTDLLFKEKPTLYGDDVRGYVIEEKYSMEIDTQSDWDSAEAKFVKLLDAAVD